MKLYHPSPTLARKLTRTTTLCSATTLLFSLSLAGCAEDPNSRTSSDRGNAEASASLPLYFPYSAITAENLDVSGRTFVSPQYGPVLNGNGSSLVFLETGPTAPISADQHLSSQNDMDVYSRDRNAKTYRVMPLTIPAGQRATVKLGSHAADDAGRYVTATVFMGPSFEPNRSRTLSIVLWDTVTNQVTTIEQGTTPFDFAAQSTISADGSVVAFVDLAGKLATYNRVSRVKQTIKSTTGGTITLDYWQKPVISGDGQTVIFETFADYVDPSLPHAHALFAANLTAGTVAPLRMDTAGQPLLPGSNPSVSRDGNMIAYYAISIDIGDGVSHSTGQVFVYNRTTRKSTRLSSPTLNGIIQPGAAGNGYSMSPTISGDGRRVVFVSNARNLLGDATTTQDIYVADTSTLELQRVSVGQNGELPNGHSDAASISRDGNTACFSSLATNLVSQASTLSRVYCRTIADAPVLTGVVTDINNAPISGVSVEAGGIYANTDSSGRYQISGLKVGSYAVHASKSGYTFGSDPWVAENRVVDLRKTATQNITGYGRQPIVYAPGYADPGSVPRYWELSRAGYKIYVAPIDNDGLVPSKYDNARVLRRQINAAKAETGKDKVILAAFSMGGIVSRAYLEDSSFYQNDVSHFFDYGSPHWGFPGELDPDRLGPGVGAILRVAAPGIADMTQLSMLLFNLTHMDRASGVNYHLIGGAPPLWTTKTWSFKIPFVRRVRITIPWPDTSSRNTFGWFAGAWIYGHDDGLFTKTSTVMLTGRVDRLVTREVHTGFFGPRWYKDWDNGNPSATYNDCFARVLIQGNTYCGTVSDHSVPAALLDTYVVPAVTNVVGETQLPDPVGLGAPLLPRGSVIAPNGVATHSVVVTGGAPLNLGATWSQGSARVTLTDPSGRKFTPEYAASIIADDDPSAPTSTTVDGGVVAYTGGTNSASYFIPNPTPGTWTVTIEGGSDIPAGGTSYTSVGQEYSSLSATASTDRNWYAPGQSATISVKMSEAVQSANVTGTLKFANGTSVNLSLPSVGNNEYRTNYTIPAASGIAELTIAVTGKNKNGAAFERGASRKFMVMSNTTTLAGSYVIKTETSSRRPDKYSALTVDFGLNASAAVNATVTARLVDASGNTVATATTHTGLNVGANTVQLRFTGSDIYKSGRNGPYTITDLVVVEDRSPQSILAAQRFNVATSAGYQFTQFEGNVYQDHVYETYTNAVTWAQAKAACEAARGHLVTIGSAGENEFVRSIASANTRSWIAFTDAAKEGTWQWTTGEANWYRNWASGEPNNYGGAENWTALYGSSGQWVDLPANWTAGYVCEWDPRPAAWTPWYDRDDPSGNGDNESLSILLQEGKACSAPLGVECRRVSDKVAAESTSNIMTCSAAGGALCLNASQASGYCDDIEVRFLCPTR